MEDKYTINISFIVEPPIHEQWYKFFTQKFIPFVREQGFQNPIFTRVLTNDNNAHYTYSLQIPDSSIVDYQRFMDVIIKEYNAISSQWFAEKALYYISLLKHIEI